MAKTVQGIKPESVAPLKFPSVDIVEASAGSGKTYTLAKRYAHLITYPRNKSEEAPLKTILALTFTNKATIEMKQRILEFLKKAALDAFSDSREKKDILSSIAVDFETARKNAYKAMEDIISHYNFFQVQTIDSFINMLLSGCSFHLGFASNFRIKEEYRSYLEYSLDRLIERGRSDKDILRVFKEFLKYYLFVENREGWFFKQDILGLVESLYNYSTTYGGMFAKPDADAGDLLKKKREIIKLVERIRRGAPDSADGRFLNSADSFLEKNKDSFKTESLSAFFAYRMLPMRKDAEPPQKIVRLWNNLRRDLDELCVLESVALFKPYIEIFNLVWDEFRRLAGTEDVVFLQELNTQARGLIGGKGITVPEIYYRLATRFRHYLIDEFQDTSRLQWRNIVPMIDEALSSGGSLFYVGDKKQAIYRFRGGDVSLFNSVQEDLKNYDPKLSVLSKNYRSGRHIVEFNNRVFSEENLRRFAESQQKKAVEFDEGGVEKILSVFSDSKQESSEGNSRGYVSVESFDAANVDERNAYAREKVVSAMKELKKRFSYGDIAILVRENNDVKLFTAWLIEENIPVESEKTLNIREHPLIKELISFLRFLNSPIDNLSFASFITGEIFQRASGIAGETVRDFLFRLRVERKRARGIYLYREFRRTFPQEWNNLIEHFFKSAGFVPLYELVTTILSRFMVMENFPEYQGFFMRLLELIKEKEEDYPVISKFLENFEEIEEKHLFVDVRHTDSVVITTIHKAKGLEFPVVIIPFLEIDVTIGSGGAGPRRPFVVRQEDNGTLSLIQLKKIYASFSDKLAVDYRIEFISSLIDELNSLYVALTRAKYEMYVFIPSKTSNKNNIARDLISGGRCECGQKMKYHEPPDGKERPLITLPVSRYSDWIGVLKDEFITESEIINRGKILKGEIYHSILSFIGNLAAEDMDACLGEARDKTRLKYPYAEGLDEALTAVRGLAADKKFLPFFRVEDGAVFKEKEIVDSSGNTKRIDRLIVMPKEAWIIDFKSSKDESEGHRKQVLEYIGIVRELYPSHNVKGFLIYLDTPDIEEVN